MTSLDPSAGPRDVTSHTVVSSDAKEPTWWSCVETCLERGSERLNPILVKEARQALKSKQFLITFTLLLTCGWVWSLLGIALLSPGVYYAPGGRFMLVGYFVVLSVPVLLIVPFSAFRSLASEREDGTFELLSITSLTARQIVTGKLGSAVMQLLVYYSALTPCVAFTYLLRGVDILTILYVLCLTFLASVLLSALGLVVGTLTQARHWQVVLSVLLLIGLLLATFVWIVSFIQIISFGQSMPFDDHDFWIGMAAVFTFFVSYLVLFVLVAAAQISFSSDNRSTRLRVVLLAQQVLWIGWMMYYCVRGGGEDTLYVLISFAAIHWFLAGSLLIGETAQLSPRVKRSLPQSFLGRMTLTWFNPGSGTGYTFAVANLFSLLVLMIAASIAGDLLGMPGSGPGAWLTYTLLATAYVTVYLGVGRIVLLLLQKVSRVGMLVSFLGTILLASIGAALPAFLQAWLQGYSRLEYSPLQATNWMWTLIETAKDNLAFANDGVLFLVPIGAVAVFLLNLVLARVEVEQVRQETPSRVLEDEQELHPGKAPVSVKPKSPWSG